MRFLNKALDLAVLVMLLGCHDDPANVGPAVAGETQPAATPAAPPPGVPTRLMKIGAGSYRPLFSGENQEDEVAVQGFLLEEHAVTNRQFLGFVAACPTWRRSGVRRLFADQGYLAHWKQDLEFPAGAGHCPVTHVSWFAARAYARWVDRRLPTLAEWEYVAAASQTQRYGRDEPGFNQRILDWYAKPSPPIPDPVRSASLNYWRVYDLHGSIWEWVEDFNSALVTGESRADSGLERSLFCGSGSLGSADPSDYAAFMRSAFRSSLAASYTVKNLGFRCAANAASR